MSDYKHEKVLRVPLTDSVKSSLIEMMKARNPTISTDDLEDDWNWYLDSILPELFDYATPHRFQFSPTKESFLDYVLEVDWDSCGDYGKTRPLSRAEQDKYSNTFHAIDPSIDMSTVRLVDFCWYDSTDAPGYYDESHDSFYDEI